jgi:acetyl-CoA carboxylase carboxyltransferase component
MDLGADDTTQELRRLKEEARWRGGPQQISARRRSGRNTARERVVRLLDPDSFVELDVFVEGAVTGHGTVAGRAVYVFSEDGEIPRSALGEGFSKKIVKVMDLAVKNGAPLVGIYDHGGAWDWGTSDADGGPGAGEGPEGGPGRLGGYAGIFSRTVLASGVVPQIAAIMGPCSGAAAFSATLADVVIVVRGEGRIILGDPDMPGGAAGAGASVQDIGGARALCERSGAAHLAADDESECLDLIAAVLSYLPQNNLEEPPLSGSSDPTDRKEAELEVLASGAAGSWADMRPVVGQVVDDGELLELMPGWAKNLVVGFARLGGRAIGVVFNQPGHLDGRLDQDAAAKAARFVRLCDAFNLPLVTFVDTPGFLPGEESGEGRILREAAKLMYAYCEATVPKLCLVTHRAYAEGFEVMGSKSVGSDFAFAWPSAEIGPVAPKGALDRQDFASPYAAAVAGHVDDIIEPAETRPRLIAALEACASKRESRLPKKHGNIPL